MQGREPAGQRRGRSFQWEDARGPSERLDVDRPRRASACAPRGPGGGQLAGRPAQLLTRGKGAGAPGLVSTDVSHGGHAALGPV